MTTTGKIVLAVAATLATAGMGVAAAIGLVTPVRIDTTGGLDAPVETEALADGEWFGMVAVETSGPPVTLSTDPAEMLTGAEAHAAAVDAGVISADEELPNDMFILNPDHATASNALADDATVTVISATVPGATIDVSPDDLAALFDGSYTGDPVYGVFPGEPIAMQLTVSGGMVTAATAVYLP